MPIRMVICGACGEMASDHWLNCPTCGALKLEMADGVVRPINGAKAIEVQPCERCGTFNDVQADKCQTCGNKVDKGVDNIPKSSL